MRKLALATVTAALLAGLAGCTSNSEVTVEALEEAPSAENIEAAPLQAVESDDPDTPEAAYLDLVRQYSDRGPEIADATDAQLIAAGKLACEQLAEGKSVFEIRVVDGEKPDPGGNYPLSSAVAGSAAERLCQ